MIGSGQRRDPSRRTSSALVFRSHFETGALPHGLAAIDRSRPRIEYRRERPSDDGARRSPVGCRYGGKAAQRRTTLPAACRCSNFRMTRTTLRRFATRHHSCAAMRPTWCSWHRRIEPWRTGAGAAEGLRGAGSRAASSMGRACISSTISTRSRSITSCIGCRFPLRGLFRSPNRAAPARR